MAKALVARPQGLALRAARIERDFTVEDVARASRITPSRQRQIELATSLTPEVEDRFWRAIAALEEPRPTNVAQGTNDRGPLPRMSAVGRDRDAFGPSS